MRFHTFILLHWRKLFYFCRFFCTPKAGAPDSDFKSSLVTNATEELRDPRPTHSCKNEKNDVLTSIFSNEGEQDEKPLESLNIDPNTNMVPARVQLEARRNLSAFGWSGGLREKSGNSSPAAGLSVLQQFHRQVAHPSQSKCTDGKTITESDQNITQHQPNFSKQSEESKDDNCELLNSSPSLLSVRFALGSFNSSGSLSTSTSSELAVSWFLLVEMF